MTAVALPILQNTQEWLDARLDGIGSSEAAAALGMSRWESTSRLWALKLRLIPGREPTLPMLMGSETEPLNARLYEAATGTAVRRVRRLLRSQQYPWMLASLDRRAGRKLVELKFTERSTDYGEPGTDEVPDEVLLQVLHQLVVTGLPSADVSVLFGGRQHSIYHVEADAVAMEELVEREHAFWRSVEDRVEPPIDGSEATREYLRARYPGVAGLSIEADEATRAVMAELRGIRRNDAQVKAARDLAEARIKAAMGDATELVAPGIGRIPYPRWASVETTSDVTDWESVAKARGRMLALAVDLAEKGEVFDYASVRSHADAVESIHTNAITTVTKKKGERFGPPVWEEAEESEEHVA